MSDFDMARPSFLDWRLLPAVAITLALPVVAFFAINDLPSSNRSSGWLTFLVLAGFGAVVAGSYTAWRRGRAGFAEKPGFQVAIAFAGYLAYVAARSISPMFLIGLTGFFLGGILCSFGIVIYRFSKM